MRKSQPDTFSFAFVSTATPLHPHIKVAATILLLQLLGADNFSGNNTRSAVFEVLGKWFNVPTEREFLQTPGTDEPRSRATHALCLWREGLRGTGAHTPSEHHCDAMMLPHRELTRAGLTPLITCPRPKPAGVKVDSVLMFRTFNYHITSYCFLTILKEAPKGGLLVSFTCVLA